METSEIPCRPPVRVQVKFGGVDGARGRFRRRRQFPRFPLEQKLGLLRLVGVKIRQVVLPRHASEQGTNYAVLVGVSNGDGAWRGMVTILELIDRRPYIFQLKLPCAVN
jgi:hypothetical protein